MELYMPKKRRKIRCYNILKVLPCILLCAIIILQWVCIKQIKIIRQVPEALISEVDSLTERIGKLESVTAILQANQAQADRAATQVYVEVAKLCNILSSALKLTKEKQEYQELKSQER